MALLILHDPYEWFDPERGRQGILIHSSQIGGREHLAHRQVKPHQTTWADVWRDVDEDTVYAHPPPFVILGQWTSYHLDGRPPSQHPYGPEAYQVVGADGKTYIYPNKEAADAHQGTR